MDELIRPEKGPGKQEPVGQPYGDLTALNTRRLVLDAVGKEALADIMHDYLSILGSAAAVYEANGDYAQGIFTSGWCRKLDAASRHLCGTEDNQVALQSGRWHCHESCWSTSKASIETGQAVDLPCRGGIWIYAVPIQAGGKVVGSINFGYGNPPQDPKKLQEIAEQYGLVGEDLRAMASAYVSRSASEIEAAKTRLVLAAKLIGLIVESKQAEAERARLYEHLQDSHEQLRALAKRLLEVQEEERRLLARELHDEIGQQLTALKLDIQVLQSATDPARAAARFTDCIGIADRLLDVVRARSLNLRPPLLDELGLGPSLESLVRIQAQRAELAVDLAIEPNVSRLPALLEITAFRIVQESLTNVIRHAQAARVAIAVQSAPERLALTIRDDGRGFDIHAMREQTNTNGHTGLSGLRERVKLLGGRFVVESAPGRGTEVRVTLPLEPAP